MATSELIPRLASHRVIGGIPPLELEWVASHGTLRHLELGEVTASPALGPMEHMYIILSGRLAFYGSRGGAVRRSVEWQAGDVTGCLPYSRMTIPPGEGRVEEAGDVVLVHRDTFPEMIRECPVLTARLVGAMIDRARRFQKDDLQLERLVSLGKLAAGLAHELDNPASAALRGARLLSSLSRDSDLAARDLGERGVPADQLDRLATLREACLVARVEQVSSPLEQARREEAIADWLDERRISGVNVEALGDSAISIETLESIVETVAPEALEPAVRWLAAGCALFSVTAEIQQASERITELVRAVKGFSQVNRSAAHQPTDVREGLTQTLAMLRAKARSKSVQVDLLVESDLPRVRAVPGELNQIWHNLIDNALDAVSDGGTVTISAQPRGESVVVSIEDNGSGIPAEIRERIFEPFFTTKPMGEGTGLGLDIVAHLVDSQDGTIDVSSVPGHTEFRVTLPVAKDGSEIGAP